MHTLSVTGVSTVTTDDMWVLASCRKCWATVQQGERCCTHPEEELEARFLIAVDLSDGSGSILRAIMYNEVVKSLQISLSTASIALFQDVAEPEKKKILLKLQSQPWSVRVILKSSDVRQMKSKLSV